MSTPYSRLRAPRSAYSDSTFADSLSQDESYAVAPESEGMKGLRRGQSQLLSNSFFDDALSAEVAGDPEWEDLRDAGLREQARQQGPLRARVGSVGDVRSLDDAADYLSGGVSSGVVSSGPSLAASVGAGILTRGKSLVATTGAGFVPAYQQMRGEAAGGQYGDPVMSQADVDTRDRAATGQGIVGGALESIVPGGVGQIVRAGVGGGVKQLAKKTGIGMLEEGGTEMSQTFTGDLANKYVDPNQEFSTPIEYADSGILGAASGGAMTGGAGAVPAGASSLLGAAGDAAQGYLDKRGAQEPPAIAGPVPTGPVDLGGGGAAAAAPEVDPMAPVDLGGGTAQTTYKERMRATVDRLIGVVPSSGEFSAGARDALNYLREVAGDATALSVDGISDLLVRGANNVADVGATVEETQANMRASIPKRVQAANAMAQALLADPEVPEAVKRRIQAAGEITAANVNTAGVAVGTAMKAMELKDTLRENADTLINATKDFADKVADKGRETLVRKNNLMGGTPEERAALLDVTTAGLTPEAANDPDVMARIGTISRAVAALALRTGSITAKDAELIANVQQGMSLFADPVKTLTEIMAVVNPGVKVEGSFASTVLGVPSAFNDTWRNGADAFAFRMLTPEARTQLTPVTMINVGKIIDQAVASVMSGGGSRTEKLMEALGQAFGGKERAEMVVDYYVGKSEGLYTDVEGDAVQDESNIDEVADQDAGGDQGITQRGSTGDMVSDDFIWADAKQRRPFFAADAKGISDGRRAAIESGRVAPNTSFEVVGLDQFANESPANSPDTVLADARSDILQRVEEHYTQIAKVLKYAKPSHGQAHNAVKKLILDDSPRLNEGYLPQRREAVLNLLGQLSMVDAAVAEGGVEAGLKLFSVLRVEGSEGKDLKATDADIAAMGVDHDSRDVKTSKIRFKVKGQTGQKAMLVLSAGSMVTFAKNKGSHSAANMGGTRYSRAAFADAVNSVLAREDIEGLVTTDAELDAAVIGHNGTQPITAKHQGDPEKAAKKQKQLLKHKDALQNFKKLAKAKLTKFENLDTAEEREAALDAVDRDIAARQADITAAHKYFDDVRAAEDMGDEAGAARLRANPPRLVDKDGGLLAAAKERLKTVWNLAEKMRDAEFMGNLIEQEGEAGAAEVGTQSESAEDTSVRMYDELGNSTAASTRKPNKAREEQKANLNAGNTTYQKITNKEIIDEIARRKAVSAKLAAGEKLTRAEHMADLAGHERFGAKGVGTKAYTDVHGDYTVNFIDSPQAAASGAVWSSKDADGVVHLFGNLNLLRKPGAMRAAIAQSSTMQTALKDMGVSQNDFINSFANNNDRNSFMIGMARAVSLRGLTGEKAAAKAAWSALSPEQKAKLTPLIAKGKAEREAVAKQKAEAQERDGAAETKAKTPPGPGPLQRLLDEIKSNYTPAQQEWAADYEAQQKADAVKASQLKYRPNLRDKDTAAEAAELEAKAKADKAAPKREAPKKDDGKNSEMRPRRGPRPGDAKHEADRQAILAEIRRTRGKDIRLRFRKLASELGAVGEYTVSKLTDGRIERVIEIAVNAGNVLSVARHESLHDFFAMLSEDYTGRSIKRDLNAVSGSPKVMKRLKELLEGHPNAIAQLNDPEERTAYMYQFWAEGLIELSEQPTGWMRSIRSFLADVLGLVTKEERAEELLRALQDGSFADPSTVAFVLQDIGHYTASDRLEQLSPLLNTKLKAVATAAPDRLREFQNEALNTLADKFSREEGKLGFIQKREKTGNEWTNRLADIFKGTTAAERNRAARNLQTMKDPSNALERSLQKYLEDMWELMHAAGVKTATRQKLDRTSTDPQMETVWEPLRKVEKGYFPRQWNSNYIAKNKAAWKAALKKHSNMDDEAINRITQAILTGSGQLDLAETEHALGFSPYALSAQERGFKFITPANAGDFTAFQNQDLADIMMGYTKQAVHRAEYAREFGNDGEQIRALVNQSRVTNKDEVKAIFKTVEALEGSLGNGTMSMATKELMSNVMTLENIVLLPLTIFSQVADPIVLAARSGDIKDAGRAYVAAVTRLKDFVTKQESKTLGEDMAKLLGIISEDSVLEAMGTAWGSTHMSAGARKVNSMFFKYNGMQGWNNTMRIVATEAGAQYIVRNKDDVTALEELGLKPADVKLNADGSLNVKSDAMKEAMFRFVDQAVLRPSASQRPVWMSDPRFMLIGHLKQFVFAMQNVVLKRANKQMDAGNMKPWGILMLAMPAVLAADMAKAMLTGSTQMNSWGFKEYFMHSFSRSGLAGVWDFSSQPFTDAERGRLPGEGLIGPAGEHLAKILRFVTGAPGVDLGDVIDRTIPGARFVG